MERLGKLILPLALILPCLGPLACRAPLLDRPSVKPLPTVAPPHDETGQTDSSSAKSQNVEPSLRLVSSSDDESDSSSRPSKKSPLELPPPASGEDEVAAKLPLPPLEAGDRSFPINLATALRLADARPLVVAIAQAKAWMAEAQLQRARVFWVPAFMANATYVRHDGPIDFNQGINVPQGINALGQDDPGSFGKPLNQNVNFFYGGGALFLMEYLTDMLFQPLIARQNLNAARWDIQTAKNDALFMTAKAYFNVHKYRGQYTGALYTVRRGRRLVEAINTLSKDLVPAVEVDRARTLLADLEQQAVFARRDWRRASADLTRVLRLDPRAVVEPLEHDHLQITLIDPSRSLDDLMPIGLTNRPELASHQALIQAALARIRREKTRPFLPVLEVNGLQTPYEQLQFGVLGMGSGGKMNNWSFRDDFGPQVLWVAEGLGLGNMARVKEQRAGESLAIAELFQVQDDVAAEITTAQARLQSAAARVVQSEREVKAALINYNGSFDGLKQTRRFKDVLYQIFRPQEVVYALKLLKVALDHYFATVAEYNQAQFQLFHALGYPARELAFFRQSGEVLDVNTLRPTYLPPVGTGPPPPTR